MNKDKSVNEIFKVRIMLDIFQGQEQCGDLIEAHKACMRALGFKI